MTAHRPALFLITLLAAFFMTLGEVARGSPAPAPGGHGHGQKESYINYTTVTGFFLQSEESTNATEFDYISTNLGLINRTYPTDDEGDRKRKKTQWERFAFYVNRLNRDAPRNVQYKVLIMGRHGEGFHNVAEAYYGTPLWDCYWSLRDGNDTVTWADARITETGRTQALAAHTFWQSALSRARIPAPEKYYVSPLTRCLETVRLTFGGADPLPLPPGRPFRPVVKELLREAIGLHTCDRRGTASYIRGAYPGFALERGFAETDPLYSDVLRETNSAQVARLRRLLDDVFTENERRGGRGKRHDGDDGDEDDDGGDDDRHGHDGGKRGATFISFTSHSGSIGCILQALGHRRFSLRTGAVIPVFVRAERVGGPAPSSTILPSTAAPTCTVDPTATPTATGGP